MKGIDYILDNEMITQDAQVELFSWGEPFLNAELDEIYGELWKRGLHYRLSTNGSILRLITSKYLEKLDDLCFSISGFTQESYGKIHGLNLERVLENISRQSTYFIENGFSNKLVMNFHVYQYNVDEIKLAKQFCDEHSITLIPHIAYFADSDLFWKYRLGKLDYATLEEASRELFLYIHEKYGSQIPEGYQCRQLDTLVVDEQLRVLPCSFLTGKNHLESLFAYNLSALREKRKALPACKTCIDSKSYYLINQDKFFNYGFRENKEDVLIAPHVYFDSGAGFSEERTQWEPLPQNGNFSFEVTVPAGCKRIRLDPTEGRGCIITHLDVIGEGREVKIQGTNAKLQGGLYFFETTDPQIIIELKKSYSSLLVRGEIAYLL